MHDPLIMKTIADMSRWDDLARSALPDAPQVPHRPSRVRRVSETVTALLRRRTREPQRTPATA